MLYFLQAFIRNTGTPEQTVALMGQSRPLGIILQKNQNNKNHIVILIFKKNSKEKLHRIIINVLVYFK